MNGLSPWAVAAAYDLLLDTETCFELETQNFKFAVQLTADSVWILTEMPGGARMAFRAAFSPGATLKIQKKSKHADGIELALSTVAGKYHTRISIDQESEFPVLHYTTTLTPVKEMTIPFWPKDILVLTKNGNPENTSGQLHASQFGTRTGFIYMSQTRPKSATLLYHQNLTAISDYCDQTETSLGDTVGGEWPELGFSLPPSKKSLSAGKGVVISDAFIAFTEEVPEEESAIIRLYLDLLARVYLLLPKPETKYQQWSDILNKGLRDLVESPGCWSQVAGQKYFNAYVSDHETPPEIMVQLAILSSLLDYVEWSKSELKVIKSIQDNLPTFFDEKLGTIIRWLPAAEERLQGEEEQKEPKVMDSWYLHHPLLNLSRLALKGDKMAEKLFLDSLGFAIKVAHHFNYHWPVFYKVDTLEVIKAETAEGKGGEKDVAGIYTHVMVQAWELTGEKRYLNEAEKAAKTLQGYGFELFYQANNTAFSAGALLRLYKITGNELYLNLSYMCLAGIFRNTQLWDCNYGYGKHFPKFFALYPLNDAPYIAVYEEHEVFCAFHDYLKHAEGIAILPSLKMLIAEYIRYLVDRAAYYYPPMLPVEMLEEKPKIGEVDPKLWIALEDLQDGWLKSGTVGQEVYGAGNAFGILPRHYLQVPDENFNIYIDYPTQGFKVQKNKPITFKVLGDARLSCRMMFIKKGIQKLPEFTVTINGQKEPLKGKKVTRGYLEYQIPGDSTIRIRT